MYEFLQQFDLGDLIRMLPIVRRSGYETEEDGPYTRWNGLVWQVAIQRGLLWG